MTTTLLDVLTAGGSDPTALDAMADVLTADIDIGVTAPASTEVSSALADLLDEPVGNLAHRAWRADRALDAARARTSAGPERREVLRTLEHTIRWSKAPEIDLMVAGSVVYTLHLEVAVEVEATAVHIVVEDGEVVSVSPGAATAEVAVTFAGREVARRKLVGVDLTPEQMAAPPPAATPVGR